MNNNDNISNSTKKIFLDEHITIEHDKITKIKEEKQNLMKEI
jgi:hypothetical protein